MLKKLGLLVLLVLMSGCATTGHKITDHTDRSIVYGWLDIDDVDGNYMFAGFVRQYTPTIKNPYYTLRTDKFKGGYIYYFYGLPNGAFKLDSLKMQSCLGIFCGNTIYNYDFGTQGTVATVKIKKPGTYYMGSYKMAEVDTGMFEQSKFNVTPTKKGPSQKEMLQYILTKAPSKHPVVAERIRLSLRSAK